MIVFRFICTLPCHIFPAMSYHPTNIFVPDPPTPNSYTYPVPAHSSSSSPPDPPSSRPPAQHVLHPLYASGKPESQKVSHISYTKTKKNSIPPSSLPSPIEKYKTYLSPTPPQPKRRLIGHQLSKAQHQPVDERQEEVYRGAAEEAPEGGRGVEDHGG